MSPLFRRKDPLAQSPLSDPVAGRALVVRGDTGYSTMKWWSARLLLRVAVSGQEPFFVTHEGNVVREKTPIAGMVLPVDVERADPQVLRVRWDEVPSIDQRIADRDPLILDPESTWRTVLEADPRQEDQRPTWGDRQIAGWPPAAGLPKGRQPGTALVVAHSGDPEGCFFSGNFVPPDRGTYSFGGNIGTYPHRFPGWLLLCVVPAFGEPFGFQLETTVMRDHLSPVLPVSLDPSDRTDVDIAWDNAPTVVTALAARKAADAALIEKAAAEDPAGSSAAAIAAIQSPRMRKLAERMAKKGAVFVTTDDSAERPPDPTS